jgi:branched-chain amino acid transport system substrate-binding protein
MSIDPETRDVIEDMHILRVEMVDGKPQNVEFDLVKDVKDPVKERMKKK